MCLETYRIRPEGRAGQLPQARASARYRSYLRLNLGKICERSHPNLLTV